MRRDDAISILQHHRGELKHNYGVGTIALFGSVARDEAGPKSDVDILVGFDRPVGLFGLFALQDRLEEIMGCKVDVGTVDSLKPRIRTKVLSDLFYVV